MSETHAPEPFRRCRQRRRYPGNPRVAGRPVAVIGNRRAPNAPTSCWSSCSRTCPPERHRHAVLGQHGYVNTIPSRPGGRARRQHRDRRAPARLHALERDGDGGQGQPPEPADGGDLGGHIGRSPRWRACFGAGFNHFWHAESENHGGDLLYIQGHSAPGVYARAFLEGRLTEEQLLNFRQEVDGKGLSSYPHPKLMPEFWQFPTVSMGLGPLMAIYQARFLKYLHARGIANTEEPQGLGVLRRRRDGRAGIAGRHRPGGARARQPGLRHQLQPAAPGRPGARQRQDHPGAGRRVPRRRLERHQAAVGQAGTSCCSPRQGRHPAQGDDGNRRRRLPGLEGQRRRLRPQELLRQYPEPPKMVVGHMDRRRDLAPATAAATTRRRSTPPSTAADQHKGQPTVILVKTVKGFGMLGKAGEGKNTPPDQEADDDDIASATASGIPIPTTSCRDPVLQAGRRHAGNAVPAARAPRRPRRLPAAAPHQGRRELRCRRWTPSAVLKAHREGREISTTMAFVRIPDPAARQKDRPRVVPILARRGPHLRHGRPVPPDRHLQPAGQYTPVDATR